MFRDLCEISVSDGILFDPKSVKATEIRLHANYGGVRVTLCGLLAGARCPIQADIGFGDVVTPGPMEATYPTLLADLPAPHLRVYPKYTVIAEKYHAIVELGMGNSRMKDYFDIWILLQDTHIDRSLIARAIHATFERRQTSIPSDVPIGLSGDFASDVLKQSQWNAFAKRNALHVPDLAVVVAQVCEHFDDFR